MTVSFQSLTCPVALPEAVLTPPQRTPILTPGPEARVLTDAGPQFHQHVLAAQLGEQLKQAAHRGPRASLPVVQQLARGVSVRLQMPDLQVLEAHLLRQRGPIGRHLRPHVQEQRQAAPHSHVESSQGQGGRRADRGRGLRAGDFCSHGGIPRSLSAVGSRRLSALPPSFTATPAPAPGPAPPVSVSEKRRPALQSGAPAAVGDGNRRPAV
uniref:Uncharacterized protein n=1 Tax=Ursus americanus TaxID=9643 RepID=A0A452QL61_URSAM